MVMGVGCGKAIDVAWQVLGHKTRLSLPEVPSLCVSDSSNHRRVDQGERACFAAVESDEQATLRARFSPQRAPHPIASEDNGRSAELSLSADARGSVFIRQQTAE
jgi:hypothetical protein